jgi:hypothetical protein
LSNGRRPEVPCAPNWGTCQFTPAAVRVSMKIMRPLSGRHSTFVRSMTVPRPPVAVSRSEALALTSTVSDMSPIFSSMFTVTFWPIATVTPERTNLLKPGTRASMR